MSNTPHPTVMPHRMQPDQIPVTIVSRLEHMRRIDRTLRVTRGLVLTAAVLLTAMMMAMLLDWLIVLFEPTWRVALTVSACAAAVVVLVRYGLLSLRGRRTLSALALDADTAVPELQERWSTIVELSESRDPDALKGSKDMFRQVRREAEQLESRVEAGRIVSRNALRQSLFALGIATAVLLTVLLIAQDTVTVLMKRFWLPTRPITLTTVTAKAGDRVVPIREPLILEADLAGRLQPGARLFIETPSGNKVVAPVPSNTHPDRLTHRIASVDEPLRYRFRSGDGQTPWHTITPVERPNIAQARFRVVPPEYANLPADESSTLPHHVRALEGSRMELEIQPTGDVASLALQFDGRQHELSRTGAGRPFRYETTLTEHMAFAVHLTDRHGLENIAPPRCRVTVYADRPPTVSILSPEHEIVVRPDDVIEIEFEAEDDFGIAEAELVVTIENRGGADGQEAQDQAGGPDAADADDVRPAGEVAEASSETRIIPIPIEEAGTARHVREKVTLDLGAFELEHGQELSYLIRVRDTRAAMAESGPPDKPQDPMDAAMASAADAGADASASDDHAAQAGQADPRDASASSASDSSAPSPQDTDGQQDSDTPDASPHEPHRARVAQRDKAADRQDAAEGSQAPAVTSTPRDESRPPDAEASESPPPDGMTRRILDTPQNECSSQSMRVRVDKWVGSFEGQARQKLQIAIDGFLKRLDAALEAAQTPAEDLLDHLRPLAADGGEEAVPAVRADAPDPKVYDGHLAASRGHLGRAQEVIAELKSISADTPYAFIGLQLHDIGQSHVEPARLHLADAQISPDGPASGLADIEKGAYHIARAREMLASLTRRYEAVKREEQLADTMKHLAEMHQVFLEDMHMLLGSGAPSLNPRAGEMAEMDITDEYKKALEAHYERLKEIMNELARLLAEDPELLRRFMAMKRLEGNSIRDQLTMLALRQQAIHDDTVGWAHAAQDGADALRSAFRAGLNREQLELAALTARFKDDFETWKPRGVDADEPPFSTLMRLADDAARQARQITRSIERDGEASGIAASERIVEAFVEASKLLSSAMTQAGAGNELIHFATKRLSELERLTHRYRGWIVKARDVEASRFGRGAAYDQELLRRDTMAFGDKLDVRVGVLAALAEEIGPKMRELERLIGTAIVDLQTEAWVALRLQDLDNARKHEALAIERFAEAEERFDEILTLVEKAEAAKLEGQKPGLPCPVTLEQILAMLEREMDACENLGAVVRINLAIMSDMMSPAQGAGGGMQAGGRPDGHAPTPRDPQQQQLADALARAAQAQLQENAEAMREAQQRAEAEARRLADARRRPGADGDGDLPAPGEPAARLPGAADWASFVSRLDRDLQQARDHVPPERYRAAVDAYLRAISELSANPGGTGTEHP